ncbi:lactonase family protein [Nocardia sp. alder85J]|uniref:lactonase family protein n=1 Tax=Nocardia sp. alder85J TaxID=2862949 RepID=UPI001CD7C6B1|nr:beta-propeller fold lactonase family protein [Nocardia sp. alder85J]MCX4095571.1 beta-propeller fold lactonase family protein [Nocardia sp. alder85J]
MTSDSTTTDVSDVRPAGRSGRRTRRRAGWTMAVAAAVLPGFAAGAQSAAADPAGYYLYAHGYLSDGVTGFAATDTGQPTPIAGRPATGMPNWPQAASPDGRHLVVAPTPNPQLIPYALGAGGTLTPGVPLALPDVPVDITFAPNSHDAYVLVGLVAAAVVPVRFGDDGRPVRNGPAVPLGAAMDGLGTAAVSPDGRNLYVASVPDRQVLVFDIAADGTVTTAKQRVGGGLNPLFPIMTPDGRHLFFTNELSGTVQAFLRADDGTLSEVAGSPYPAGVLPHVPSITPDGRYLCVPNMGSSHLSSYAIEPDGGLRSLPDVDFSAQAGVNAEASVMSPSGRVLWALGMDPLRGGEEVLSRFGIGDDGHLSRDDSGTRYLGTALADGRTLTLVPAH